MHFLDKKFEPNPISKGFSKFIEELWSNGKIFELDSDLQDDFKISEKQLRNRVKKNYEAKTYYFLFLNSKQKSHYTLLLSNYFRFSIFHQIYHKNHQCLQLLNDDETQNTFVQLFSA